MDKIVKTINNKSYVIYIKNDIKDIYSLIISIYDNTGEIISSENIPLN